MDENDSVLLSLILSDSEKGLSKAIDKYSGYVYAIVRNRLYGVCAPEDIEEAVSDVFADLYRNRFKISLSECTLKGYISMLAKRTAIDRYRRSKGRPEIISSDDDGSGITELSSDEDICEQSGDNEERRKLLSAIKSLGEPDSTIILRKYWLCETSYEISKAVMLSPNAVTKRLLRARNKLKLLLSGKYEPNKRKDILK